MGLDDPELAALPGHALTLKVLLLLRRQAIALIMMLRYHLLAFIK